jgi:hypothetical protein
LVFAKVEGPGTAVGVVDWTPSDYEGVPWWRSSERARELMLETVGYLFEALLNSGRSSNSPGDDASLRLGIQGNYEVPSTSQTTVTLPYTGAQAVGDLNVVIVGCNDPIAQASSVTDLEGNVYQLAAGPTLLSGSLAQSIYLYADRFWLYHQEVRGIVGNSQR